MNDEHGHHFEFSALANNEGLADCRAAMERSPLYQGLPVRLRFAAELALDELATNAIKYGNCGDSRFTFGLEFDCGVLRIDYTDHGAFFDPWERTEEEPLMQDGVRDVRIGGRGLMMMKGLSSSRGYERRGDTNLVTLTVNEMMNS